MAKAKSKPSTKDAEVTDFAALAESRIKLVKYRIVGVSPLLQNNPAKMKMASEELTRGKKIPPPAEEAESAAYRDEKTGNLYGKLIALHSSVLRAASGLKIGKMSALRRLHGSLSYGYENQFTPLIDPKSGKPIRDYKILTVRAVIQKAGILRSRPMIEQWAMEPEFELDEAFLNAAQLEALFNIAGRMVGIGDWRPDKSGIYGRFTARQMK